MKKILIINANYYKNISANLIKSAKKKLKIKKFNLKIINAPGVFEIPYIIKKFSNKFDGFLALGCVIKGDTPHFNLICKSTFDSILKLSIDLNKPITNGIITALDFDQARQRSSTKSKSTKPNKGEEAAKALIDCFKNEPK